MAPPPEAVEDAGDAELATHSQVPWYNSSPSYPHDVRPRRYQANN